MELDNSNFYQRTLQAFTVYQWWFCSMIILRVLNTGRKSFAHLLGASHIIIKCPSCGSAGKESACSAGDAVFDPWVRKIPWKRDGYSLQYSCLENPMEEEPGGIQSMGLQRVGHDWAPNTFTFSQCIIYLFIHLTSVYLIEAYFCARCYSRHLRYISEQSSAIESSREDSGR